MARVKGALGKKTLALIEASGLTVEQWQAEHTKSKQTQGALDHAQAQEGQAEIMPAIEGEKKKRGRKKGSKNKNITMGAHAKLSYTKKDYSAQEQAQEEQSQEIVFAKKEGFKFPESRIPRKERIGGKNGMEGKNFNHFSGKDYAASLEEAYKWAEEKGIELLDWYAQEAGHKAILVSFNK